MTTHTPDSLRPLIGKRVNLTTRKGYSVFAEAVEVRDVGPFSCLIFRPLTPKGVGQGFVSGVLIADLVTVEVGE
jgi:hypothetical protein